MQSIKSVLLTFQAISWMAGNSALIFYFQYQ